VERILVTGGAGFIGAQLARFHQQRGDDVHILVRPGRPICLRSLSLEGVGVHRVRLDCQRALIDCLDDVRPTIIYHMAGGTGRDPALPARWGVDPLLDDLKNTLTLLSALCEAANAARVLIRAGSLAEYGNGPAPAVEDQREDPLTTYTSAMVAGLHYARMLQPKLPCPIITARFALVYGPGQKEEFFLPWLIRRCLSGQQSTISRPGSRRNMIFVNDLVEALHRMTGADLPGGSVVNLCTSVAPTIAEIAQLVVRVCNVDRDLVKFEQDLSPNYRVEVLHGSPARARDLLHWTARTPLEAGITRCVEHTRRIMS